MNIENDWDHVTEASMVEGSIKKVTREEMAIAIKQSNQQRQLDRLKYAQR